MRAAGGRILVEAESTCTVYGMPRAISEAGLADAELPLRRAGGGDRRGGRLDGGPATPRDDYLDFCDGRSPR